MIGEGIRGTTGREWFIHELDSPDKNKFEYQWLKTLE